MDTLQRTLGLRALTALVVGTVIGSGVYLVPAVVLRQVQGSVGLALLVWVAAGVLSVLGALTFAELATRRPEAGGFYAYIRDGFGPFAAFLCGWTAFLVTTSGSLAALAVAFSLYAGEFVPLTPWGGKLVAVSMLATIAFVNVRGTTFSAGVQTWTTAAKVLGILGMAVALWLRGDHRAEVTLALPPLGWDTLRMAGLAMVGVLWAYEGWAYVTFAAGEARDPQRTFPRAIVLGTFALIVLYVAANLGYLAALAPAAVMTSERVAATAMQSTFGPWASQLLAAMILLSIFSSVNGITLASPRLYFAMANDRLFFQRLATVHPRFGTPAVAILVGSAWAIVLTLSGTFEQLLTYVVFTAWIFYGLAAASLFMIRRRDGSGGAGFRVPGYPVVPALFVLVALAIVLNAIVSAPWQALIGLSAVGSGVPAYRLWRRGSGERE